jgi:hypothetical protein
MGLVLDMTSTVLCSHGAPAQPSTPFPRVTVSGKPVVTLSTTYVVSGCPQASVPAPVCASVVWMTTAMRVKAGGAPLLLSDSQTQCPAPMTPATITPSQTRVQAL